MFVDPDFIQDVWTCERCRLPWWTQGWSSLQMTGPATEKALSPFLVWCSCCCRKNVVASAWKCYWLVRVVCWCTECTDGCVCLVSCFTTGDSMVLCEFCTSNYWWSKGLRSFTRFASDLWRCVNLLWLIDRFDWFVFTCCQLCLVPSITETWAMYTSLSESISQVFLGHHVLLWFWGIHCSTCFAALSSCLLRCVSMPVPFYSS